MNQWTYPFLPATFYFPLRAEGRAVVLFRKLLLFHVAHLARDTHAKLNNYSGFQKENPLKYLLSAVQACGLFLLNNETQYTERKENGYFGILLR